MRLNSINPKDNPMEEVLYCFGGDTDSGAGGSAGDFEGTNFGGDTATAGGDLGGASERDSIADEAGVSRNTIVGSGPAGGNVVRSADGSPVKSARAVEEEARSQGVSVAEINDRINKADRSVSFDPGFDESDVADTSALDEIAYEFDTINVEPEVYEDQILRDLRKEDYSAVFDQPTTRAGQVINVDPDASLTQSPAGQVESIKGGRSQSAKTASDDTGFDFFEETPLVDVLGDDPYQLKEESRFDLGLGRTVPKSPEPSGADLAPTPRSLAIEDAITAYQSSVFPDQLLGGTDPQNLIDQIEGRGTVGDRRRLSIPEIQNITAEFLKNPANRETIDGYALADLEASTQQERAAAAAAVAAENQKQKSMFTGLEMFDPEAQQTRKPSEAPPDTSLLKPDEDPRRITETGPDYTAYALDPQATVQRNPAMGFSPYEQLSTIDPETGERVALDFRTSLGGPDNFGKVDFGRLADPINVFGVDVPTGFGVAEGILNTFIDPTGTTERAVYEGGVRSVDGRATGLDTGIDLVTDGKQEVIGGYDRDRNIVYATEGNLFNPALSDFYEEKRRVDDASRDDGDEPRPLAGGLEILPQSTLSAYDFGSSSFDPFPTGTGTGTGSIDSLPAIGDPAFDFIRDFGAFTLSPRAAQAPIGTYSPEYLAPISELGEGERERLAGLLGTPLGAGLGLSSIDTAPSPIESAEALIKGLGSDQSV
jgi:hypothetical protein